jgi:hypothetical protein
MEEGRQLLFAAVHVCLLSVLPTYFEKACFFRIVRLLLLLLENQTRFRRLPFDPFPLLPSSLMFCFVPPPSFISFHLLRHRFMFFFVVVVYALTRLTLSSFTVRPSCTNQPSLLEVCC